MTATLHVRGAHRMSAATLMAITSAAAAAITVLEDTAPPAPLPCRDFERFPWLALVGLGRDARAALLPEIRDRGNAGSSRAARRRLEKAARKGTR